MARKLANRALLRFSAIRRTYDQADLVQEGLGQWLKVRGGYRVDSGASPKTYMSSVVWNRFLELLRSEKAARRKINYLAVPFSKLRKAENKAEDEPESQLAEISPDLGSSIGLKVKLDQAISRLSPRQRAIVELTKRQLPKNKIANELRIHRTTLNAELARIRALFLNHELQTFLE